MKIPHIVKQNSEAAQMKESAKSVVTEHGTDPVHITDWVWPY